MTFSVPGSCFKGQCLDIPVRALGTRMEVMEWTCADCNKHFLVFYDLDLIIEKDRYGDKLLKKYLNDSCFRALCVKKARFERLPFIRYKEKYKGLSAARILQVLYRQAETTEFPDYVNDYVYRNREPEEVELNKMHLLLEKHGDILLYNETPHLPGFHGGKSGGNIPSPFDKAFRHERYSVRNNFHELNHLMLDHFIRIYEEAEQYEAAHLLHQRKESLPSDFPDYSQYFVDLSELRKKKKLENEQQRKLAHENYMRPYIKAMNDEEPVMPSGMIKPYPNQYKDVFFYHDFDGCYTGLFNQNEEKYHVGDCAGFEIFKLRIREARKVIGEYGHSHYLIRRKNDPGENCTIILLLENGDTVVNVFYYLNTYLKLESRLVVPVRKYQDMEGFEWATRHLLAKLLPYHFKLDIRPGVCDEE
ncbi:MAG: hypothetical protein ACKOX7_03050 [Bacteroidota bacterium]